jgi:hypothetical protein
MANEAEVINYSMINNVLVQLQYADNNQTQYIIFYDHDSQGLRATAKTAEDALLYIKYVIDRNRDEFVKIADVSSKRATQSDPIARSIDLTADEVKVLGELTSGIVDSGASVNTKSYIHNILGMSLEEFDEIARDIHSKLL